jgi:hypothetical protein
MKTTVELPDALFAEVKRLAAERGLTMRSILEDSLRRTIDEYRNASRQRQVLRDTRVGAGGLRPEIAAGGWDAIRAEIYPVRDELYRTGSG